MQLALRPFLSRIPGVKTRLGKGVDRQLLIGTSSCSSGQTGCCSPTKALAWCRAWSF